MENWREVPGFNGKYQIDISTKEGRCRVIYKKGPKLLKGTVIGGRYLMWRLGGRSGIVQQAARWIALTYPELVQNEYFEGAEIDHIDTDTFNNQPSNIRWVDRKGQFANQLTKKHMSDSAKVKIFTEKHRSNLSKSHKGKLINDERISKPVLQFTTDGEFVAEYPSIGEAARQNGIPPNSICDVCKGRVCGGYKRKTAGVKNGPKYIWKYKEQEV